MLMLLEEGPDTVNEHVAAGIDAAPGILTGEVLDVAALPLVGGEENLGAKSLFELRLEPAVLVATSLVGGIADATTGCGLDACRIEIDEDRQLRHDDNSSLLLRRHIGKRNKIGRASCRER